MNPDLLFVVLSVLGFVFVAGAGFALAGGDAGQIAKRAQALVGEGKDKRGRISPADAASQRRKQIMDNLKATEKQQRRVKLTIASRLNQAGLTLSVRTFWIISACLAATVMGASLLFHMNPLVGIGLGFAAGLGLPRWMLGVLCQRRYKKFTEEFPNAIDIVVRGIKSGLPVHDCLKIISRESPEPVGSEFQRLVEGLGVGMGLDQGLERMYERMPIPEVRFLAIVMAIQQKTGGNLAEALSNLSTVLRGRKLMREKIKAMSGEAVASSFIIGSLPPGLMILVTLTSPSYMAPMYGDPRGHFMLLGAAIWMGTGIFAMRRMINFKI